MSKRKAKANESRDQSVHLLIKLCDRVFTEKRSHVFLANHASYLRDTSSVTLSHFAPYLSGHPLIFSYIKEIILGLLSIIIRLKFPSFSQRREIDTHPILFVSHLTNSHQLTSEDDPYFGKIPKFCHGKIASVMTFRVNHLPRRRKIAHDIPRLIVDTRCWSISAATKIFATCLKESLNLLQQSFQESDLEYRRFLQFLACTQVDRKTLEALRLLHHIEDVALAVAAEHIFYTYEGYAWERAMVCRLRNLNPNIKMLAYQHAVISGRHRAINKSFGPSSDPDLILASGNYMPQRLISEGDFRSEHFSIIGSPKAAMGIEPLELDGNILLAVPQGFVSETIILGNYLAKTAKLLPNVKCKLRLHPGLPWGKVRRKITHWDDSLGNLEVSSLTLDDDIKSSSWVLYRGSSAIIHAISFGRRPIYIDVDSDNIFSDIIPDDIHWRYIVQTPEELVELLEQNKKTECGCCELDRKAAMKFAINYYTPLDLEKIEQILK